MPSDIRVAIEGELTPFSVALEEAGFIVLPLTDQSLSQAHAVVVQGTDDNFLGMEDTQTQAPVINADGMTPEQVVRAVRNRALPLR